MKNENKKEKRIINQFIQVCGLLTVFLGFSAILGWIFDIPQLASFDSSKIPMALSTAVLFVAYGLIIFFHNRLPSSRIMFRVEVVISSTGILVALLFLYLSLNGIRPDAEHLGIKMNGVVDGLVVGHMSPVTAFCFMLVCLSFLIILTKPGQKKQIKTFLIFAVLVFFISIILLLSYLLGTPLLYEESFIPPALTTSLTFLFLGIALLLMSGLKVWSYEELSDVLSTRYTYILALVFIVVIVSVMTVGYSYYKSYEKQFRAGIEHQLSSIASLKVHQIVQWRKERLGDAEIFYKNAEFSGLVKRLFNNQNDFDAKKRIQVWLEHIHKSYQYNRLCLHDNKGNERFLFPNTNGLHSSTFYKHFSDVIKSGKITFEDFYLNDHDKHIYLNVSIPLFDTENKNRVIGILVMRIDPEQYLYPLINEWPTPSKTAETLLIRREGNDALFLNELKFQKNTALNLRRPLTELNLPASRAVLGKKEFMEGIDYRGVPVIAYVCPIPNSPWFLVARMDISEVYAPLREWFWAIIILVVGLLTGSGASVGLVWRQQRSKFYKERYQSTENIRKLNRVYAVLSDINQAIVRIREPKELFEKACDIAVEKGGFQMAWIGKINSQTKKVDVVASKGVSEVHLKKIDFNCDDDESQLGIAGRAMKTGVHVISNDIQNDENVLPLHKDSVMYGSKSFAAFPIKVFGQIWGVFKLYSREIGFFDKEELKLLDELAMDISFSIEFAGKEVERKRSEEVLRESEERFRALIEHSHDAITLLAADGTVLYDSPSIVHVLGYSPTERIGRKVFEFVDPEECQSMAHGFARFAQQTGAVAPSRVRFIHKNGTPRWIDGVRTNLLHDPSVEAVVINYRDITESKRAEEEVRESEERFRMVFENALDGISIYNEDPDPSKRILIECNERYAAMAGRSRDELLQLGKTRGLQIMFDDKAESNRLESLDRGTAFRGSFSWIRPDGKENIIEYVGTPITWRGRSYTIGIDRDITERKRTEGALQEKEKKFKELFDNAPIGYHELDLQGRITRVNRTELNMLGYTEEEMIGQFVWKFVGDEETSKQRVLGKLKGMLLPAKGQENVYRRKDQTTFPILVEEIILRDATDNIIGIRTTIQDITERKRAEEALKESQSLYHSLIEQLPNPVFRKDREGRYVLVNSQFCKLKGLKKEDFIGKKPMEVAISELEIQGEQGQATKYANVGEDVHELIMQTGKLIEREEEYPGTDGGKQIMHVVRMPVFDFYGTVIGTQGIMFDISEPKRAEEALTHERNLLRALMDNTPDHIYFKDLENRFIRISKAQADRFGLSDSTQAIGKTDFDFFTKDHARPAYETELEIMKTGRPIVGLKEKETWPDGTVTWVSTTKVPLRDINGEIIGTFGISRDITESKRAEEGLVQEQNLMNMLMDTVPDHIYFKDRDSRFIKINKDHANKFGLSDPRLAIGKTDFDFFTEEHARPAFEDEQTIIRTGKPIIGIEEKETWPDGTVTWVSTTKMPLRDKEGNIIGTFGVSHDITERKRAEEEIIFEKNKFVQLFDNSPIAIALVDDQDKVVHINESFTKLFGYFLEEIKGLSINEIIVPPELKEEALTFLDETQSGNQINKESYRKEKDGSNIFVQIIGVPIVINDKTIGIYDMYVNLTQRKDVEEKMKIAKELAEQSDKLKSEFLAQMSHEIRTPINVIVGNVDYLNQSFSKKMDSDARDCFDGINLASKRIIRTVDLILNAAELQTSGYKPQFVKVDLNSEILNKLYQEHQLSAKQKGLEIIYTCKEKDTKVIADEYSITQIFANLIDNAIKYTKKGKIEILLGKNKTGNIMVEVKDTGIGISKEFFPRLFELFTQEEQGYTRSFEGNGLGLALVKNYCDINNAIIEVESEKNVGSTFRVIFRS